ncbi:MAG: Uma2 family endonuclease [Cyclobacteriaceae bacterium]|nr:Uma2 family endonuclease [Cyclobacteriaceae bacterium]
MGLEVSNEPTQLIHGKLVMSPAPSPQHQRISRKLLQILLANTNGIGEVFYSPIDLFLNDTNVLQPDLVFILNNKKEIITTKGIEGIPDLVVEVLSPSNTYLDRVVKKDIYLANHLPELWLIDPQNKKLEIYVPQHNNAVLIFDAHQIVSSITIPNLQFSLSTIFE